MKYFLNHLEELESESIFIMREVAAQFENPVILFSGGKDSILMVYLAIKAFYPARVPFPSRPLNRRARRTSAAFA